MHVELPALVGSRFVNSAGQILQGGQHARHELVLVLLGVELAELLPLDCVAGPPGLQKGSMEVDGRLLFALR